MYVNDNINNLAKQIMASFGGGDNNQNYKGSKKSSRDQKKLNLTPSQILVIIGILAGSLEVNSILIDKDQLVEIVLAGSLKQKTQLEMIMDEIGKKPFDEVLKAMLGRL